MSNNEQNNLHSWKTRLDELDSLAGEPISGKEQLWTKLHERMKEKPARKTRWFYWAAAACLPAMFLFPWTRFTGKADLVGKHGISTRILPVQKNETTNLIEPVSPVIYMGELKESKNDHAVKPVRKLPPEQVSGTLNKNTLVVIKEPVPDDPSPKPDTIHSVDIAAAVPPVSERKKLPVVRYNELPGSSNSSGNQWYRPFVNNRGANHAVGSNAGNHVLIKNLNVTN